MRRAGQSRGQVIEGLTRVLFESLAAPHADLVAVYRSYLRTRSAMAFIFQLMLVAPLSVAGGAVGFTDHLGFYWTTMTALLHRDITSVDPRRRHARGRAGDG